MKPYRLDTLIRLGAISALTLALGACGKNDDASSGAESDSGEVMETSIRAETMAAEPAIACLMSAYNFGLRDSPNPALRANAPADIPKEQLIVWSAHENYFAAVCGAETSDAANAAIRENPYLVVNEAAKRAFEKSTVYTPSPKGDFEKTDAYDQRIAAEKAAFEAASAGQAFGARDIDVAWSATFGPPEVYGGKHQDDPDNFSYDADQETLSFLIRSRGASIPVTMSMTPEQIKALTEANGKDTWGRPTIAGMSLDIAMQYINGKVVIKYIGFFSKMESKQARIQALPFSVSAMPVNIEIPFQFGK